MTTNTQFAANVAALINNLDQGTITQAAFAASFKTELDNWTGGSITKQSIATTVAQFIQQTQLRENEVTAWWAGTGTGGFNSDGTPSDGVAPNGGYYPITAPDGTLAYHPSPDKLANFMLRGTDAHIDIATYFKGMLIPNEVCCRYIHTGATSTYNQAKSKAQSGVAPTGARTITITKNGSAWGTVTWTAGSTTGTVTLTSNTIAPNDVLVYTAPSTQDATFADVSINLSGNT